MRIIAPMMILIMMTSTLAGCTGGDPDAGGNDEIDIENIQLALNSTLELIEEISNDSGEDLYYMNGNFAYNGTNYEYDQGVWSEVQNGQWTWVGTPANWIDVVTINQKEGEIIKIHYNTFIGVLEESDDADSENLAVNAKDSSTQGWEMNCSNGIQTGVSDSSSLNMPRGDLSYPVDIFPTAGQECDYTLNFKSTTEFSIIWWNIVYSISSVSEGTSVLQDNNSEDYNDTENEPIANTNLTMEISYVPTGMDENARTNVTINFELYTEDAPKHVDNFLTHIEKGNYNSTIFHRIIDNFMIQGGDIEGLNGYGGYAANWYGYCNGQQTGTEDSCSMNDWTIPDEASNGLTHSPGALSMAKTSSPHTGGSQFFIVPSDSNPSHLNGVHTVFGYVTSGLESIKDISEVDTGDNDRPVYDIVIESIYLS